MDFVELVFYLLVICLGILAGIFTGLLPGIHINLVASFVFVNLSFLIGFFDVKYLVIFILVMGVVHSFIDFIPSVIFGVPSSDNALSVLPSHRMVQNGEAFRAIFLSASGSLAGVFLALIFMPFFYFLLNGFYDFFKNYIPYFLVCVVCVLILMEKGLSKKFWAFIVVLFGAGLGTLVLNSKFSYMPLLPLFSGLFGVSSLILSIFYGEKRLPEQNFNFRNKLSKGFWKASVFGSVASAFCLITPGIGNSQAATIVSLFFRKLTSELFIVVVGVINTFSFFMSLVTFFLISKSRNGSLFIVSQIIGNLDLLFLKEVLFVMVFVGIVGFILTMFLGKIVIGLVSKFNMDFFNWGILFFLIFVVSVLSGWFGFLVLIASTFLGLFCVSLNVRRVHLMSVLIIPIVINLL